MNIPAYTADQPDIDLDEEKKIAESYLIHYDFYKERLEAKREEIIEGRPTIDDMPKKDKYLHGNPTFTKAVKLMNKKLVDTENWLKAVEATRAHFARTDSNHGIILIMKYEMGLTAKQIALDIGISPASVFNLRNEILNYMTGTHDAYIRIYKAKDVV